MIALCEEQTDIYSVSAVAFKSNMAPLEHRDIQEVIVFVIMSDTSFVVRVFREVNQLNMATLLLGFRRLKRVSCVIRILATINVTNYTIHTVHLKKMNL